MKKLLIIIDYIICNITGLAIVVMVWDSAGLINHEGINKIATFIIFFIISVIMMIFLNGIAYVIKGLITDIFDEMELGKMIK